ncbi:activity-dependent neuroprotector homeobox protein 2-like [Meriones unguiculatus]|uniref:activity-dependent neuroprotector homeobox protein 2-like n=1 Tax=Meriones unguiculatus TaxID=10047 RepID=UPI00293E93F0|nr:activity-dependent neuroprotector homeobox protein 2-like [Meriones unguiculatus]
MRPFPDPHQTRFGGQVETETPSSTVCAVKEEEKKKVLTSAEADLLLFDLPPPYPPAMAPTPASFLAGSPARPPTISPVSLPEAVSSPSGPGRGLACNFPSPLPGPSALLLQTPWAMQTPPEVPLHSPTDPAQNEQGPAAGTQSRRATQLDSVALPFPASQDIFPFEWKDPESGVSGQLTWIRLPQGFKNSPTIFDALRPGTLILRATNTQVTLLQYVDDILLAADCQKISLKATGQLLQELGELGYRASAKKAQICQKQQPFGPVNKSVGVSNHSVSQAIQPGILLPTQPMGSTSQKAGPAVSSVGPGTPTSGYSNNLGVLQNTPPGTISVGELVSLAGLPEGQMTSASLIPAQSTASGVLPTGQAVQATVPHIGQTVSSQVITSCQTMSDRVFPTGQMVSSGLLSPQIVVVSDVLVNQGVSTGIPLLGQPVNSGPSVGPGMLQLSQSVGSRILPDSQLVRADTSHNTLFLKSGSVFRKLLPTGSQVKGKPLYTLDPMPVTLPIPQGAIVLTISSQVSTQFLPPSVGMPIYSAPAHLSSSPGQVSNADQNIFVQVSSPKVDMNLVATQVKQWKICPVCKVYFPSSVYQAHTEGAHRQSEFNSSEKLEPVKLAMCAPFLKWTRERPMHCLSCKCLVSEEELMYHLLTHGLGCLFCPFTFHSIQGLLEHSKIKHLGRKKLLLDYLNRGFQLSLDVDGNLLFLHLAFIITLPREEIGEQEVHLAILSGTYSTSLVPLYVKMWSHVNVVTQLRKGELTCPLCLTTFMLANAYMLHLKEGHHIIPIACTVLSSPTFRCVHCGGIYPGSLTVETITLHLLHCAHAPKDSSDLQVRSSFVENSELQFSSEENVTDFTCPFKRKWPDGHQGPEDQKRDGKGPLCVLGNEASGPEEGTSAVTLKRQRNERATKELEASNDLLQVLALDPTKCKDYSSEEKKQFLRDYFQKKPYPSRKEVELLSLFLKMEKVIVALFFVTRRYICLKTMEDHRSSILLGFDMSEVKNVKHRLNFEYEPKKS